MIESIVPAMNALHRFVQHTYTSLPFSLWVLPAFLRDIDPDSIQALHDREITEELIHHSDRGSQYLSIRYTERLAEDGIVPPVGNAGDSYDNAMAESIIGLYKTEVIRRHGQWKSLDAVEIATLHWSG